MDLKLKDKVVLINGATGGIGRAVCFALKAEGAKIALSGRDADKVKQLAEELDLGPDRLWRRSRHLSTVRPHTSAISTPFYRTRATKASGSSTIK